MATKKEVIEIKPINIQRAKIFIDGDSDLVLNQMNARNTRSLTSERQDKFQAKETPNPWEDIITALHWYKPLEYKGEAITDTYNQCDENVYRYLLENNAPCITTFGLKKSFNQAVVRNEIDTYSTKFDNAVNVLGDKGLIPVTFAEASVDEKLMTPRGQKGPVLVRINHFSGWKASFDISYTDNVYSLEQIVNIINLAGFGLGIGSGRTSGYGRFHIVDVK